MQKKSFVNWVNKEVEKRLDDKPFSSLPLKTRVGIFLLLIAFIGGYGLSGLFAFLGINKKSAAGISGGFLSYAISWIIIEAGIKAANSFIAFLLNFCASSVFFASTSFMM